MSKITTDEDMKDFKLVLDILKNPSNEVFVSLNPPYGISFEIDADILNRNLSDFKVDKGLFFAISRFIGLIMLIILENRTNIFIDGMISEFVDKKERKHEEAMLKEEVELVKKELITDRIKERYKLKISSKAPSFSSVDWDIKRKIDDSKLKQINIPYATCKFEYQKEFKTTGYSSGNNSFDSMQINFSLDEVRYLRRIFANIEKKLELAEED